VGLLIWSALSDRGRVCRLQLLLSLASAAILGSESLGTRDHVLLSQFRDFSFHRRVTVEVFDPACTRKDFQWSEEPYFIGAVMSRGRCLPLIRRRSKELSSLKQLWKDRTGNIFCNNYDRFPTESGYFFMLLPAVTRQQPLSRCSLPGSCPATVYTSQYILVILMKVKSEEHSIEMYGSWQTHLLSSLFIPVHTWVKQESNTCVCGESLVAQEQLHFISFLLSGPLRAADAYAVIHFL
jgi:hypothetical protein